MEIITFASRSAALRWIQERTGAGADMRLHPIDAGFNPRRRDMVVLVPPGEHMCYFVSRRGRHVVAHGTQKEIIALLRRQGFRAAPERAERDDGGGG